MTRLVVKDRATFALADTTALYTLLRTDETALPEAELVLLAETATGLVEDYTGLTLRRTVFAWYLDDWPTSEAPADVFDGEGPLYVTAYRTAFGFPRRPVTAINAVQVQQPDGSWADVDAGLYTLTGYPDAKLALVGGIPPAPQVTPDGIRIEFVAGYDEGTAPAALVTAITRLAAYLHVHRGDEGADPLGASGAAMLLRGFRSIRL